MSSYIFLHFLGVNVSGKTKIFNVVTVGKNPVHLGRIAWLAKWRCYGFFPNNETVFERKCLRDIANWCDTLTKEHKGEE